MNDELTRRLPVRVVKVGGSLFDLPDLSDRLHAWIEAQPPAMTVLLAGGGEMVDFIRRSYDRQQLDDQAAHWLSIAAMGVTALWLGEVIQTFIVWDPLEAVSPLPSGENPLIRVFNPQVFFNRADAEVAGQRLPESWDVSSDSIAARLAAAIEADELVLLKSRPAPPEHRFEQLAEVGYVDAFFPQAAASLHNVRFVDLRN